MASRPPGIRRKSLTNLMTMWTMKTHLMHTVILVLIEIKPNKGMPHELKALRNVCSLYQNQNKTFFMTWILFDFSLKPMLLYGIDHLLI